MMNSQDVRVDQLEEIMKVTVKTQTDTLRVLKNIEARVEENSARLAEHSAILQEHSDRLEKLENLMTRVLEELVAIKEILAGPRGMGFILEPEDED